MTPQPTICAIATAPATGAIAVIRISGDGALRCLGQLWPTMPNRLPPRVQTLARLRSTDGTPLDQALVTFFQAPASFTGEDVVEIACHGGLLTPAAIIGALRAAGAQPAAAGEFTRRALLNGKLDLLQVEAIADVIHAQSESGRVLAQQNLEGHLSGVVRQLMERLTHLLVLVEAAIDFSLEEHVYSISAEQIEGHLNGILPQLDALLASWNNGRLRSEGIRVAIVGRPNAGKSTLLNLLVGTDRALVSDIAGTTRDYIEESVQVDGLRFVLVDTAGLRDADEALEARGIERTWRQVAQADAIWVVVDATCPSDLDQLLQELTEAAAATPRWVIWNKMDLDRACAPPTGGAWSGLTALSLEGAEVDALHTVLRSTAAAAGVRGTEHAIITRSRHHDALQRGRTSLGLALQAAHDGRDHELVAMDLHAGLAALGELTGAVTADDILARIFDGFCIGK